MRPYITAQSHTTHLPMAFSKTNETVAQIIMRANNSRNAQQLKTRNTINKRKTIKPYDSNKFQSRRT